MNHIESEGGLRFWLPTLIFLFAGIILILSAITLMPDEAVVDRERAERAPAASAGGILPVVKSTAAKVLTREFWHLLCLELGLGLVVGCVISLTIEAYMRSQKEQEDREREEEIRKDVFVALFETALSKELVNEMQAALISPGFVRRHLEITISLRALTPEEDEPSSQMQAGPPAGELLVLQQRVQFRAQNTTNKIAQYQSDPREYMVIKHPEFPIPFKEYRMSCGKQVQHLSGQAIVDAERKNRRPEDGGIWYRLGPMTVEVRPKEEVAVSSVVERVCRYADTKTFRTTQPAMGIVLTVVLEDRALYDRLEFAVDQAHRKPLVPCASSKLKTPMTYQWELRSPLLPSQGVILHWRPKSAGSSARPVGAAPAPAAEAPAPVAEAPAPATEAPAPAAEAPAPAAEA
jgi:hypothetical protein